MREAIGKQTVYTNSSDRDRMIVSWSAS